MSTDAVVPDVAAALESSTPPPRPPRLLRLWAVVLIPLTLLLICVIAPLFLNDWVRSKIVGGLARAGLDLDPRSELSVSVFGARLHGRNIRLTAHGPGHEVARIAELDLDLALIDTLTSQDIVIESLVCSGMNGDLSRRGTWSPLPGDDAPPSDDGKPIDWETWYKRAAEAWKKHREKQQREQDEAKKNPDAPTAPPIAATAADWPKAKHYQPAPVPGGAWSRVLVRRLDISGTSLITPHPTPIRITAFRIAGAQLSNRQAPGERQTLSGTLDTDRAGSATFEWLDDASSDAHGHVQLHVPAFPVDVLGDPSLGGAAIAAYGATGSAQVRVALAWKHWDLNGQVSATVAGLHLTPIAGAPQSAVQAASLLNRVKGRPLAWPVLIGGRLDAPIVLDSGLDSVMKSAAVEAGRAELEERGGALLNKGLDALGDKVPGVSATAVKGVIGSGGLSNLPSAATAAGGVIKDVIKHNPFSR